MLRRTLLAATLLLLFLSFVQCKEWARALVPLARSPVNLFRLAAIYGNHMVLQRGPHRASLWGYASPGASISVSLDGVASAMATANAAGLWRALLPAQPATAGVSRSIAVASSADDGTLALEDVLFGDIWVCGGQSNMAFTMGTPLNDAAASATLGIDAGADIADSANYPGIRVTTIGDLKAETRIPDFYPTTGLKIVQPWAQSGPSAIGSGKDVMGSDHFSAVCYYYGRGLHKELGIPIGLVASAWGGTSIEDWMDYETLQPDQGGGDCPGSIGGGCCGGAPMQQYNGMIAPMQNMTIKGVVFYQGESNVGENEKYTCRFGKMMDQWRRQWHEGTSGSTDPKFPFGIVQIGPDSGSAEGSYAIRQGQTAGYGYCPNQKWPETFLATAYDTPNPPGTQCVSGCIHNFNKAEIGRRLAAAGLTFVYQQGSSVGSGPRVQMAVATAAGVELSFSHTADGFQATDSNLGIEVLASNVTGRQIDAGAAATWVSGAVVARTKTTLTVAAADGSAGDISAVRYAYADKPCPNQRCAIYNSEGIPSAPFWINVTASLVLV